MAIPQHVIDQFSDVRWRLNNLYYITDRAGKKVKFVMNTAQEQLFDDMWYLNIILKARQRGFSTLIQIYLLDACMFNSNVNAGTIAHTREDAEVIFRTKAKYPYEHLPDGLKAANSARLDSARELVFANDSSLRVGTSLRSGTYQYLHVSEHGKICAKYPDKAEEIRTGALNTVQAGQQIFIESTAEGREGDFYDFCERARNLQKQGKPLTKLDFKFHFFPWWDDPDYVLDPDGVTIEADMAAYFAKLAADHGISLTAEQKAWYVKKAETQQDMMGREYPSTPDEAFAAAIEGAYYSKEMARIRRDGRIQHVPYDPRVPVNTFWDIGRNDDMTIWFHQHIGRWHYFIDYYENHGEWFGHYANLLNSKGYTYGRHYLPHDGKVADVSAEFNRADTLAGLGIRPITVVERSRDVVRVDIPKVREILPMCIFDEAKCANGIKHLDGYRREWDDKLGVWKDTPRHDDASHGADGFRTFACGYMPEAPEDDMDDYLMQEDRSYSTGY